MPIPLPLLKVYKCEGVYISIYQCIPSNVKVYQCICLYM